MRRRYILLTWLANYWFSAAYGGADDQATQHLSHASQAVSEGRPSWSAPTPVHLRDEHGAVVCGAI
ncbi:MAG: hypothetical protein M1136_09890 [Chloroflexi bacterium]|nr:hypothetical protein [Chloroflexota bacterium]